MARDLNNIAQSHSNKLARNAQLEYSDNKFRGEELGEILFYYSTACSSDVVIDSWNKDSKTFKYNKRIQKLLHLHSLSGKVLNILELEFLKIVMEERIL